MKEIIFFYFIHILALFIIFSKIFIGFNSLHYETIIHNRYLGPYDEIEFNHRFKILIRLGFNINEDDDRLFDVKDFTYVLNSDVCKDATPLLIVIVSTNPKRKDERNAIRKTWGKADDTVKLVFLVGLNNENAQSILEEQEHFGDIVQGSFIDSYRNLTYKHIMGLKWVTQYCSRARYVLKTDDDVMINISGLKYYLVRKLSPWGTRDLVACDFQPKPFVPREGKWEVTIEEYPEKDFPNCCLGWAIVYSPDIIKKMLKVARRTSFFWIDDIFITGLLMTKLNISLTSWEKYIHLGDFRRLKGNITASNTKPFLFGPWEVNATQIHTVWKKMPDHWIWNTSIP